MVKKQKLSPYEQTQLARYGYSNSNQIITDEPVEYLTGKAEFRGLVFTVTRDVLIPRIETEKLVELVINELREKFEKTKKTLTLADVGTGSGAIAISLARHFSHQGKSGQLLVWASDVSTQALKVAQKNARILLPELPRKLSPKFLVSDLLSNYPEQQKFDFVVANLPYIPSARLAQLADSVRKHEPMTALDGGPDGLGLIRKLLSQTQTKLKPNGQVFLEVDDSHSLAQLAVINNHYNYQSFPDFRGVKRFVCCQLKNTKDADLT